MRTLSRLAWPTSTLAGKAVVEIEMVAFFETWVAVADTRWLAAGRQALPVAGRRAGGRLEDAREGRGDRLAAGVDGDAVAGRRREREAGHPVAVGAHLGRQAAGARAVELEHDAGHGVAVGGDDPRGPARGRPGLQPAGHRQVEPVGPVEAGGVARDLGDQRLDRGADRAGVGLAGRAVADQAVHVEHHGGLAVRGVRAAVLPEGVGHPALLVDRDRAPSLLRRPWLAISELVVAVGVPEAQVEAEGRAGPGHRPAVVAEPADAVAVALVGADAGRAARVAPLDGAGVVLVRRSAADALPTTHSRPSRATRSARNGARAGRQSVGTGSPGTRAGWFHTTRHGASSARPVTAGHGLR